MRQRSTTLGKRLLTLAMITLALVFTLTFNRPTTSAAAFTPCQDLCEEDLKAQRAACLSSGLPPLEVIQCYQDARDAFDLCMADCQ